jgi:hypothetical protein
VVSATQRTRYVGSKVIETLQILHREVSGAHKDTEGALLSRNKDGLRMFASNFRLIRKIDATT